MYAASSPANKTRFTSHVPSAPVELRLVVMLPDFF
jgi:hypothetical protein